MAPTTALPHLADERHQRHVVGAVGSNPGPNWEVKGTGDFNGDGKSDILWQGEDGTAAVWLMDGTKPSTTPSAQSGTGWEIKGTGDFNGDGKSDILWQGHDGTPAMWLMDGTHVVSVQRRRLVQPGLGLARDHLVLLAPSELGALPEFGIFNGDGKSDILWQGQDGTPAIWLMDGTNVLSVQRRRLVQPGVGLARDHLVRWI